MDQQSTAERRGVAADRHRVVTGCLRYVGLNIRTTLVALGSFRR
jgi:hypothetical protein